MVALHLGLTTSTPRFEAALLRDGEATATIVYEDQKAHAERMFGCIDDLLADGGATKADLTGVICDIGPGSFTGIRVGLAAAKGIAMGLGVPLWPVTSLRLMCADGLALRPELDVVAAVLDAKRGELFVAAYDRAGASVLSPRAIAVDDLEHHVRALVRCGARGERTGSWLDEIAAPRARAMASFAAGEPPPLETIEPIYLRAADAKRPALAPDRRQHLDPKRT